MEALRLTHKDALQSLPAGATLPEALQTRVDTLDAQITAYEASPNDKDKKKLEAISAKLFHAITDFIENDLPEPVVEATPPVVEPTPPVVEPVVAVTPPVEEEEQDNTIGLKYFRL